MQLPSFLRKIPFNIICFTFCEDLETQLMPALLSVAERKLFHNDRVAAWLCL